VFGKKDEPDPTMPGWTYRADCWNVRVDQLREPSPPSAAPVEPLVVERCPECQRLLGRAAPAGAVWSDWCGCPFD